MANENEGKDPKENGGDDPKQESALAKATRLKRQYEQSVKKLSEEELEDFDTGLKTDEDKSNEDLNKNNENKSDSLDYGQLAYLKAHGIETDAEIEIVEKVMQDTGKELKDVVGSKYIQSELTEVREQVKADTAAAEAANAAERGDTVNTKDKPDYWVKKGELPPNTPENQELRREVVDARLKAETSGSKFSDTPVVE